MLMEEGGTGGALFRNMYRDFLKESYDLLKTEELHRAWHLFAEIAPLWTKVSASFKKTAETGSIEYIEHASKLLIDISQKEKKAMEILSKI